MSSPTPRALLPRVHAPELMDHDWFPAALRDPLTDYLETVSVRQRLFDPIVPVLERGLAAAPAPAIIDLGSGGGGPLPHLRDRLAERGLHPRVVLTDKHPNARARARAVAHGDGVEYLERPVDALQIPADLRGLRTLFNAFHHLRPEEAHALLEDAQRQGAPIAVFEVVQRSALFLVASVFIPLQVLLYTPVIRPRSALRLALTYVVPVLPLAAWWDGFCSSLRAYRRVELERMTASLAREGYSWEVGEVRTRGKPTVLYVLGVPTRRGG